jgi:hypothetical protein
MNEVPPIMLPLLWCWYLDRYLEIHFACKGKKKVHVGPALVGKDIVFRFIIELKGFWPLGNNSLVYFYMRNFERWYFGSSWNLRLVVELYYLEGFWFLFKGFFEHYVFAWWNIWVFHNSFSFALRYFLM